MSRMYRMMWALGCTALMTVSAASTAQAQRWFGGPKVGDDAPDFSFTGETRYGALRDHLKLSDFRGQTVVLAFFPGARTPGCTMQMTKYRDNYHTWFHNGDSIVVIGISIDADTTLASWAHDAHFPMLFASDAAGDIGKKYGAFDEQYHIDQRLLYIIDPDGKIKYEAKPFNVENPQSFVDMAKALR